MTAPAASNRSGVNAKTVLSIRPEIGPRAWTKCLIVCDLAAG